MIHIIKYHIIITIHFNLIVIYIKYSIYIRFIIIHFENGYYDQFIMIFYKDNDFIVEVRNQNYIVSNKYITFNRMNILLLIDSE